MYRLMIRLFDRHRLAGVTVFTGERNPGALLAKLNDALTLVERHAPWQIAALRTRAQAVLITWLPAAAGRWLQRERLIVLDTAHVAKQPAYDVAATLIHEVTHATLFHLGVPCGSTRELARCEWICYKAELRFVRRLSVSHRVVDRYRRRLDRRTLREYEAAAIRARHRVAARAYLRRELPTWLYRLVSLALPRRDTPAVRIRYACNPVQHLLLHGSNS
jgi:hypothetical protein